MGKAKERRLAREAEREEARQADRDGEAAVPDDETSLQGEYKDEGPARSMRDPKGYRERAAAGMTQFAPGPMSEAIQTHRGEKRAGEDAQTAEFAKRVEAGEITPHSFPAGAKGGDEYTDLLAGDEAMAPEYLAAAKAHAATLEDTSTDEGEKTLGAGTKDAPGPIEAERGVQGESLDDLPELDRAGQDVNDVASEVADELDAKGGEGETWEGAGNFRYQQLPNGNIMAYGGRHPEGVRVTPGMKNADGSSPYEAIMAEKRGTPATPKTDVAAPANMVADAPAPNSPVTQAGPGLNEDPESDADAPGLLDRYRQWALDQQLQESDPAAPAGPRRDIAGETPEAAMLMYTDKDTGLEKAVESQAGRDLSGLSDRELRAAAVSTNDPALRDAMVREIHARATPTGNQRVLAHMRQGQSLLAAFALSGPKGT